MYFVISHNGHSLYQSQSDLRTGEDEMTLSSDSSRYQMSLNSSIPSPCPHLSPNQCPLQQDVRPEKRVGTLWIPNFNQNCQCHSVHLEQHPDPTHPQGLVPTGLWRHLKHLEHYAAIFTPEANCHKDTLHFYMLNCETLSYPPWSTRAMLGAGEGTGKDKDTITTW